MAYSGKGPAQVGTPRDPSVAFYAITPSDSVPVPFIGRAIYVGSGGDLTVSASSDSTNTPVTFTAVNTGQTLGIRVGYVFATNTTASDLVIIQ